MAEMTMVLALYLALLLVYRTAEVLCMSKRGSFKIKPTRDWTAILIVIPFLLVITGPPLEYIYFRTHAGSLYQVLGTLLFFAAAGVRGKAHLEPGLLHVHRKGGGPKTSRNRSIQTYKTSALSG